jgi:hypothetical protein
MNLSSPREHQALNRLGVHYFPDTFHYRESDLAAWLPELTALGAGWVVLQSEAERAIPEAFLTGLVAAGIQPVVRFLLPLSNPISADSLRPLLNAYARWGVRYVVFFDRPNARKSWNTSSWAQQDLVERFLDRYLPFAHLALDAGLQPVLPPLEPGGNFWDTAFLWTVLQSLERRKEQRMIDRMVLSAYAWTHHHSLNWGAGGPQRWPEVRPYFTPPGDQDQRGFRIYEWYQDICQAVLQKRCPVILFQAGCPSDPDQPSSRWSSDTADASLRIARLLHGQSLPDEANPEQSLAPVSGDVIACNFWLLSAAPASPYASQSWYTTPDQPGPMAELMREANSNLHRFAGSMSTSPLPITGSSHLIQHYLLLPTYSWGTADWQWNIIQSFVRKHRPTVGFSLEEAALSARVVVIGGEESFSEEDLNWLRQLGCVVERITGDGTSIATQLGER